jgi:hypothetical protein
MSEERYTTSDDLTREPELCFYVRLYRPHTKVGRPALVNGRAAVLGRCRSFDVERRPAASRRRGRSSHSARRASREKRTANRVCALAAQGKRPALRRGPPAPRNLRNKGERCRSGDSNWLMPNLAHAKSERRRESIAQETGGSSQDPSRDRPPAFVRSTAARPRFSAVGCKPAVIGVSRGSPWALDQRPRGRC